MAMRLAREDGVFAGTSTGANAIAALRLAEQLGPGATHCHRRVRYRNQISQQSIPNLKHSAAALGVAVVANATALSHSFPCLVTLK